VTVTVRLFATFVTFFRSTLFDQDCKWTCTTRHVQALMRRVVCQTTSPKIVWLMGSMLREQFANGWDIVGIPL